MSRFFIKQGILCILALNFMWVLGVWGMESKVFGGSSGFRPSGFDFFTQDMCDDEYNPVGAIEAKQLEVMQEMLPRSFVLLAHEVDAILAQVHGPDDDIPARRNVYADFLQMTKLFIKCAQTYPHDFLELKRLCDRVITTNMAFMDALDLFSDLFLEREIEAAAAVRVFSSDKPDALILKMSMLHMLSKLANCLRYKVDEHYGDSVKKFEYDSKLDEAMQIS